MAEFLTCPWCGQTLRVQRMQEDGKHGVKRMERIDHDCPMGEVRYVAWEKGW